MIDDTQPLRRIDISSAFTPPRFFAMKIAPAPPRQRYFPHFRRFQLLHDAAGFLMPLSCFAILYFCYSRRRSLA